MNLCTIIGHAYRQEGYRIDTPGYPIEYDVDEWCERCEDMGSNTIPLYLMTLKYKLFNAVRNLRSAARRPPV